MKVHIIIIYHIYFIYPEPAILIDLPFKNNNRLYIWLQLFIIRIRLILYPDKLYYDTCNAIADYVTYEKSGLFAVHYEGKEMNDDEIKEQKELDNQYEIALSSSIYKGPKTGKEWLESIEAIFQCIERKDIEHAFDQAEYVRKVTKYWNSQMFGECQKEYDYIKNIYKTNLIEKEDGITDEGLFGLEIYIRTHTTGNVEDYSCLQ